VGLGCDDRLGCDAHARPSDAQGFDERDASKTDACNLGK